MSIIQHEKYRMKAENEEDKSKRENKIKKLFEKGSQCYQHSSDATTNTQQQQPHALKWTVFLFSHSCALAVSASLNNIPRF